MGVLWAIVIGYGLGSIPVALLVARAHGVDLFATGDGNPGAWNALEQLGPVRAAPAFVGDGVKALAAGLVGRALGDWWTAWAAVAAAMAGHAFPVWTGLRGGKAVMAFVGGMLALSPAAAGACLAVCLVVTVAGSFTWGARAAVFLVPVAQLAIDPLSHVAGTGALMTFIGLLFLVRRRPAPASAAAGGRPTT
jgi:glycerol-3-phosphate acyltransferase PlsY